MYSDHLKHQYKHTRFFSGQEEWPPDQPKHFTSLALIHHKDGYATRDVIAVTSQKIDTNATASSGYSQKKLSEQPQEQSLELSQEQPQEQSHEQSLELSQEQPQEQSHEQSLELSQEQPQEQSHEQSLELSQEQPQEQSLELSQEQPQEQSHEQSLELSQEQPQEQSHEQSLELSQERSQEQSHEQSLELSQEQPQEQSHEQSLELSQERSQEQSHEQSLELSQEQPQEQSHEQSLELSQERSQGQSQRQPQGQPQEQLKTSKDIKEIFAPSKDGKEPCSILIEGAPGIGKTVLSKEIAVQWSNGQLLLATTLLFLVFLRDPLVRMINSLKDLVKYYYRSDESSDTIASSCAEYLLKSNGDNVTFIFDGYDEYPENLRQTGFIHDVLQHKVLPCCRVVVTSRPNLSAHLRRNCDRYIKILGFAKEDRLNYIKDSLYKKQDFDKLVEYLDSHLTISSLCFIPFNMTVLLWLYKQGVVLPSSSIELYNYFICHTIRHHLAKHKILLHENFVDLSSLEEPYQQIIKQLSFLSYKALGKNQLTFTLDEIKTVCPQIDEIPEALNGFGLLQAVQHFGIKKKTTLNFVHLTVQEFLASYYVTCLSHYKEFCFFEDNFMSGFYANAFTMYVGMTKAQRPAFKQFLDGRKKWAAYIYGIFGRYSPVNVISPNFRISPELLNNMRTFFRLFKCFHEAGDKVLCSEVLRSEIGNSFSKRCVTVRQPLLPSDVECLGVFLRSRKKWQELYLNECIDEDGIQILHQLLTIKAKSTCIHELSFVSRSNSAKKVSSCLFTEIAKNCETRALNVFGTVPLLEDVVSLKNQLIELTFLVQRGHTTVLTFIPRLLHNNQVLEALNLLYNDDASKNLIMKDLVGALESIYILEECNIQQNYNHNLRKYELKNETGELKIHFTIQSFKAFRVRRIYEVAEINFMGAEFTGRRLQEIIANHNCYRYANFYHMLAILLIPYAFSMDMVRTIRVYAYGTAIRVYNIWYGLLYHAYVRVWQNHN